jgi:conjugative transposon TraK protein
MIFTKVKNMDASFRQLRSFMLVIAIGCFSVCCFALYKSYELSAKAEERIYVIAAGKAIEAFASERKDNITVEAKDHVRNFHAYFFSLDPDDRVIEANMAKAMYLADASAKKQYDNLKETGYYSQVISGNISQEISIDSIAIDLQATPYYFRCTGTIRIIRPASIVTRTLITEGYLRNVARSENNPHGFLIERWSTIENKDIKTESR